MQKVIFTLCSNNYLAHAKTLGDSVIETNPEFHFIIGLVDKRDPQIDYDFFKAFEIIDYDQIGFSFFEEMISVYNVIEFNTAVKPFYLEFLLNRYGKGSKVFYIDPDIVLHGNMNKLLSILEDHDIVLTPMLTVANGSVTTDELVALRHGIYNLGFIGVKYSDEAFRFLKWWQVRLRTHCVINKPQGLFVDQKWVDLAPLFFNGIFLFKDPGYNMAWWNFAERILMKSGNNYYVNDLQHELVFFHFSGYKVGSEYYTGRMSHSDYALQAHPELVEIFKDYSERLTKNQYQKFESHKPLLEFAPLKKVPKGVMGKVKANIKRIAKKF